jgi:chromosome partitioning protein
MATVLAISNQKGGVGKTTTAINLSVSLADLGRRTLLVDLDPQGNGTSGLGVRRDAGHSGVYDALLDFRPLAEVLLDVGPNLRLAPATRDLVGAEIELVDEEGRERRLRRALAPVRQDFDFVVVDCPPSLGLLTLNALAAADAVIVPLQAEYYAMEGLGDLLRTVSAVRRGIHPELVLGGILLTMVDPRNNLCRAVEAQAREHFGREVFETVVPRNVRLGEAPSHAMAIGHYDARSSGARAYQALAREVVERLAPVPERMRRAS